jgi:hypothetical protein
MPEFPCPNPINVRIKLSAGVADVYAEERDTATVEVVPYDDRPDAAEAAERTRVDLHGDTLVIEYPTSAGPRPRARVRVRAWVPAGSAVDGNVSSADLTCHGRFAAVTANSASGAVAVEEVAGDLLVNTASGDVRAGRVGGRLRVDSASADVRAEFVGADSKIDSASGDMEIDVLDAGLTARSASGDCRVGVARRGTITVDSASGDVSIGVATGTFTWLDLSSMSGSTRSELTMTDRAQPGAAGDTGARDTGAGEPGPAALTIQVRTMSGDIHVRRVAQPSTA